MGQVSSLSQNKSLILGNWTQTSAGSNIIFNKVTNQQIQRYQVVINDKHQLSSYAKRMQDQSGLICRLIYFHSKSLSKDDKFKIKHTKTNTGENAINSRPISMISDTLVGNQVHSSSANYIPEQQQNNQPKIYCIYTDRMIPIKEWTKEKIIDVITAFKKLIKVYGKFKVREHCICENQRKEVKVWINQNPVSNFPVEYVETEEDMIADFAAILVSKKEKIAKQLLDMEFFDEAIDHFSKLTEGEQKKYLSSVSSSNTASHRQSNVPMPAKQVNNSNPFFQHSPEVNNFYNVYIKTDNISTANGTIDNSKYKTMNQTILSMNRQPSVPNLIQIKAPNNFQTQTPEFYSLPKDHNLQKLNQNNFMDNTSILIHGDQSGTKLNKNFLKTQKSYGDFSKVSYESMSQLQKNRKTEPNQNFNLNNSQKGQKNAPKFICSTTHEIKNRSKNNSSGDIRIKKAFQGQQGLLANQNLLHTQKKQIGENISSLNNEKKFFSSGGKLPLSSNSQKTQVASIYNQQKVSLFQQRSIEQGRYSQGQELRNYQQKNREPNKNMTQDDLASNFSIESKAFVKFNLANEQNRIDNKIESKSNKNEALEMGISKTSNIASSNPVNGSQPKKKSFPKYFHDKQIAKSIQKSHDKSIDQRDKQKILTGKNQHEKSPRKYDKMFGQQKFEYKNSNRKQIVQNIVTEVTGIEKITKQIFTTPKFSKMNEDLNIVEDYEPRRRFTSTMDYKSSNVLNKKQFEEKEFKKNKFVELIDSQPIYVQSLQGTGEKFMNVSELKTLKKSNNTCIERMEQKPKIGSSYFNSSSIFASNKQQFQKKGFESEIKKRARFQSIDKLEEEMLMSQQDEVNQHESPKYQQSKFKGQTSDTFPDEETNQYQQDQEITVAIDESNRKQTFPNYHQNSQNSRKNDKQFTFFNTSQKPSGFIRIEQINPIEKVYQKSRLSVYKEISNSDEKQTLPRTTADEKEKKMFKTSRHSEAMMDMNDLHSSDPGHRIQQIVEIIEKEKQRMMMSNDAMFEIQQRIDSKQNLKFKKWEPSVNIYGSLINNLAQQNSAITKKDCISKSQKYKSNQEPLTPNPKEQQKNHENENISKISSSENIQSKKNIRKEVLMDYKGLFGDENPFQKQETPLEKQKARKLQIKRIREEEEKLLENTSSKDLLIQQKVQKQKQKHAQLKSDLSKLFSEGF